MKRWLGAADFRPMPWANGKGTTTEMAREDRDGRLLWRLSRAQVVENGPFSLFPGVARSLTVLSGPGFDLIGEGTFLQARPLSPLAFPGDLPLTAARVTAPCEDYNVMTSASLPRPQVQVLTAPQHLPAAGLTALYWPGVDRLLLTDEDFVYPGDAMAVLVRLSAESA